MVSFPAFVFFGEGEGLLTCLISFTHQEACQLVKKAKMSAAKQAAHAVHKRVCVNSYRFPLSVVLIYCHGPSIYHMFNHGLTSLWTVNKRYHFMFAVGWN